MGLALAYLSQSGVHPICPLNRYGDAENETDSAREYALPVLWFSIGNPRVLPWVSFSAHPLGLCPTLFLISFFGSFLDYSPGIPPMAPFGR